MNRSEEESFESVFAFLNSIAALDETAWKAFKSKAKYRVLAKNEMFVRQGEVCRFLGFITKGYVRHYYLVDGKEITNDFNFENMVTGAYHSFTTGQKARFNVIAMEQTDIIVFNAVTWADLLDAFSSWQKIGRILLERIFNRKLSREESFLLDSPEVRYKNLLENHPDILKRVPLQYLASYLGIKPETLSRIRARI